MKKIIPILLLAFCFSMNLRSQTFIEPGDTNFKQIAARYDTLRVDTTHESTYNRWLRFKSFYVQRLAPDYDLKKMNNAYSEFYQSLSDANAQKSSQQNSSSGVWQNVGPNKTVNNDISMGRLDKLQIDPDDITGNTIYVASPSGGGVFKTSDGGINWINFYTDQAFGSTGITEIVLIKDPATNKKYLYAAVGGGGGNNSFPFNGIYRIEIGTTVWVNLSGNLTCPTMLPQKSTSTVNKIIINPNDLNYIYLGTSKGVFYTCVFPCNNPIGACSTGLSWQSSGLTRPILGLAFDYSDPTFKSLYASGSSIWSTSDITLGFTNIGSSIPNNFNIFNNFTTLPTGLPIFPVNHAWIDIATNINYPNTLYFILAMNNSLGWFMKYDKNSPNAFPNKFTRYKQVVANGQFHDDKIFINFNPTHPNIIGYSTGGVGGETNIGGHVHLFDLNTNNWYFNTIPVNSIFYFAAGHDDAHDFALFGNNLYMTSDGGLIKIDYVTLNSNYQSLVGNGLGISTIFGLSVHEKTDMDALIGMQDNGTKKTSDLNAGNNWFIEDGSDGGPNAYLNNKDYFYSFSYAHYIFYKEASNNLPVKNIGFDCADQTPFTFNYNIKSINGNKDIYVPGRELAYNTDPTNSGDCPNPVGWHTLSDFGNQAAILMGNNNSCSAKSVVMDFDVSSDNKRIYAVDFSFGPYENNTSCMALNPSANFPVLWRSNNGGLNHPAVSNPCNTGCWTSVGTQSSLKLIGQARCVTMNPGNVDELWVGSWGYYDGSNVNNRRVAHSTDGGLTWSDFSSGLPNFPVNELIFRKGTNYEVYAATDIGVYYRNETMTSWQRVGTNLPYTVVYDIQINNCTQKLYAGTFGRGMWGIDLPTPTNKVALPTTVIIQTVTINTPQYYFNNISIPFATKLIINNTTVYMGPNTSINIEPGGQLEINNSTIQSYCDNKMWHGIFVKGNPSVPMYYDPNNLFFTTNGTVRMNNSTIRDADVAAVSLGGHDLLTTGYIYNTGGGQVFADNSTFTNNFKDYEFFPYPYKNKSYARNCTFQVTGQMKSADITPDSHMSAWGVNGVNILGCTFQNIALPTDNLGVRGSGIASIDSYYLVANYCPQVSCNSNPNAGTPTLFKNLLYGIYATGTGSQFNTITIRNTNFDNNYFGTYISGINYASVWRCNYTNIPSGGGFSPSPYPRRAAYGLYLNASPNFFCENNTFNGVIGSDKNLGCIVNNSQFNANQVYNCDFTNISVGAAAYNDNMGVNGVVGLKYNCNKFTANAYDICILSSTANDPNTDIYPLQGTYANSNPLNLVRNLYSAPCLGNENEFYSDKVSTTQIVHANNPTQSGNGGSYNTAPLCKDPIVLTVGQGGNFTRNETSCKSSNPVSGGKGIGLEIQTGCIGCNARQLLNSQINTLTIQYNNENNKLTAGNSQSLIAAINSNMSSGNLKIMLEAQSPYLGDDVLRAYFSKNGVPPGHIKQIHEINAPVNPSVWAVVNSLSLPNGIKNQIVQNQNAISISGLKKQQSFVNALLSNLQYSYNSKARIFIEDSLSNTDSLKATILNPYFSDGAFKLANYYLDIKDFNAASKQINVVLLENTAYSKNWADLKQIQLQLLQSPESYFTLNKEVVLKDKLIKIANDNSNPMQAEALAILRLATGNAFDEFTGLPPLASSKSSNSNEYPEQIVEEINNDFLLSAMPNPANINVTINYKLPPEAISGILQVIDITGRLMYKTEVINSLSSIYVSTKEWASGMYYYSLIVNNQVISTKRIIISK